MSDRGYSEADDLDQRLGVIREWLSTFPSLETLKVEVDELTPEEQSFVDYIDNRTSEQEAADLSEFGLLHPGYTEKLRERRGLS